MKRVLEDGERHPARLLPDPSLMVADSSDLPSRPSRLGQHAGGIEKVVTAKWLLGGPPGLPALVAPRRPPRDACHANGRQRTANCSLSGGDKAMNAWYPDFLSELEAKRTNDASQ